MLEVNSSPGLRGIEEATGVNVAGKIIKYIEENLGSAKSRRKDKGKYHCLALCSYSLLLPVTRSSDQSAS